MVDSVSNMLISCKRHRYIILGVALILFSALAIAEEISVNFTNWDGTSELLPGWSHSRLAASSESGSYRGGIRFGVIGCYLQSPSFKGILRKITLRYTCSSINEPTRRLVLRPIKAGVLMEEEIEIPLPHVAQKYESCELVVSELKMDSFRLELVGSHNTGNWYISEVGVLYDENHQVEDGEQGNYLEVGEILSRKESFVFDFSYLDQVKTDMSNEWQNGVSIPDLYAYVDDESCTRIRRASSTSRYAGLYVVDEPGVLALLNSGSSHVCIMVPIRLDAAVRLSSLIIQYKPYGEKLDLSWCVADNPSSITMNSSIWRSVESSDVEGVVAQIPASKLRRARYVCLKWSVAEHLTGKLVGLSELSISAKPKPDGLAVQIW